jgi:cell wall-associated NlpC family hydrolase
VNFGRTTTYYLAVMGRSVSRGSMKPGDIILFSRNGSRSGVHHVGIYIGDGCMVHAPYTGAKVSVISLNRSAYYSGQFYCARRLY